MFGQPPQPYSFGYDNVDEYGNRLFHREQGDANNAKSGSYGYRDAYGLYRRVNYVADANGFRATVDTNEPGTAPGASADVVFNAAPVVPPTPGGAEGATAGVAPFAYGARGAAPNYSSAYNGYGRYGHAPNSGNPGAYGYGGYGSYGSASGGPALGGYAYGGYTPYGQGAAGYAAGRYAPGGYGAAAGWAAGRAHFYNHRKSRPICTLSTQPPQPYSFGYDSVDEYGNRLFHSEQSDANNAKTGSYGYRDAYGLYRRVNYVADANGFRATVDTNEPGTAPGASADVVFNAAPVVPPTPGGAAGSATGVPPFAYGARGAAPDYSSAYNGYGRYGNAPYGGNPGAYGYGGYGGYGSYGSASGGPALGGYAYGGYAPYGQGAAGYAAGRYAPGGYGAAAGWPAGQYGYRRR
ncbi:hypothetical protein V5799_002381 [Amblyomma americanum]|uniref:Cuticle protein n=1 Tax=Amblyomma americanum TaxID=6943 RepID=A0AAQ4CXH3_AMBAM